MRVLSFPELKTKKGIGYSRMHLGRLERCGAFPRRIRVGANSVAWVEQEIDDFLAAKIAERDGEKSHARTDDGSTAADG